MKTSAVPILAVVPKGFLKYMIENNSDTNFLKFSTRFKVNEVAAAVMRLTPAMQTYCVITFNNKNPHNFRTCIIDSREATDSGRTWLSWFKPGT